MVQLMYDNVIASELHQYHAECDLQWCTFSLERSTSGYPVWIAH